MLYYHVKNASCNLTDLKPCETIWSSERKFNLGNRTSKNFSKLHHTSDCFARVKGEKQNKDGGGSGDCDDGDIYVVSVPMGTRLLIKKKALQSY